jgi:acyl carrier protein
MDSIALIREFLDERLGVAAEEVVSTAPLAELGVDSLMMLELMFAFEDRFGIKVPSDLENPKSVGDMASAMDGLIAAGRAS